jgi:hypothetical protein
VKKMSGRTCIVTLVLACIAVEQPAYAEPTTPGAPSLEHQRQTKFDRLKQLSREGKAATEIASELHLVQVSKSQTAVTPKSDVDNFNVSVPVIYYDQELGTYYSQATFNWKNNDWLKDGPSGNVGGREMFGIRVSQPVYYQRGTVTICPNPKPANVTESFFKCQTTDKAWDTNEYGVAMSFQDKAHEFIYCNLGACHVLGNQTNAMSGTIWFEFGWFTRSVCHQFFATYGHTWSSTEINSVGVAVDGFSVGWSSSENKWQLAANGSGKMWCS